MITNSLDCLTEREEFELTELEDCYGQGMVSADELRESMRYKRRVPSAEHAAEAAAAKAVAKEAGWVALTGTVAQKTWAESIRAARREEFKHINNDVLEVIALLDSSKLFIETRQLRGAEFATYIRKNKIELLAEQEAKNADKVAAAAKRKSATSAKKAAADLLARQLAFIVGKLGDLVEVPAVSNIGIKLGETDVAGANYRLYVTPSKREVRVLCKTVGTATHHVLTDEADRDAFFAIA